MNVSTLALLLAAVLLTCDANDAVGNANEYVDEILQNFRSEPWILEKVEPLIIPDVNETDFRLTKGTVTGVGTLYRFGDCLLDYENEVIKVTAELAVRDVVIDVKYAAKALFFWIKDAVVNANEYVDNILWNFRREPLILKRIEPLILPEVNKKNIRFTNGIVTGVSTLHRFSDSLIDYKNGTLKVTTGLALRDITIDVEYGVKALFFWMKGRVALTVDDLAVKMVLSMVKRKATMESFKVVKLGKYKFKSFAGKNKALNWMLNLIVNLVTENFRKNIVEALETNVFTIVNGKISTLNLPDVSKHEKLLLCMLN